jgi:hypothetical protein
MMKMRRLGVRRTGVGDDKGAALLRRDLGMDPRQTL